MDDQVILFEQVVERGCGIDVHRDTVVATISGSGFKDETRTFTTFTNDLLELRDWLVQSRVSHIAMESTGIYWKPVFNILEEDLNVVLVNARHIKNVPGHKTDRKDSKWIAKLLLSGLLKASFIPPRDIRELRDLFRYRRKLISRSTAEQNRFEKILQDANFKLSSVISDIFGVSGTKLIDALLLDNYEIEELIGLCHRRIREKKREELKQALVGKLTTHHKFMLRLIRKSLESNQALIDEVDRQIDEQTNNYKIELDMLQTIPGVSKTGSLAILSEIGGDMSKFPNEQHLASWAGLCPGNNESAGKKKVEG